MERDINGKEQKKKMRGEISKEIQLQQPWERWSVDRWTGEGGMRFKSYQAVSSQRDSVDGLDWGWG